MAPMISVKINGKWVPVSTLTELEQERIKQRVADRIGVAIERQIAIMAAGQAQNTMQA